MLVCSRLFAEAEASPTDELDEELADALRHLWRTQAIQYCIEHRSQIQLNDSVIYYMKNIERITAPNFMPNDQGGWKPHTDTLRD